MRQLNGFDKPANKILYGNLPLFFPPRQNAEFSATDGFNRLIRRDANHFLADEYPDELLDAKRGVA